MWGGCMLSLPYLLNRVIGPFFAGVMMAGVALTEDPLAVAILLTMTALCGFLSLPAGERLIRRVIDATA